MYLHEDRELFKKTVNAASVHYSTQLSMVEKDYYVTMILKLLAREAPSCVFKGGTSLSKGFQVLNRFSEDIDITFTEHLGEKRRKKLKHNILKGISDELHMPIINWEKTQSDRDYNCYIFSYDSIDEMISESLSPYIRLETAMASYAFPVEKRKITSYVGCLMKENDCGLWEAYGLEDFDMHLQSIERTYVDKVFALCDYFLQGKAKRYSRHMYDIYVLTPHIVFDEDFRNLIHKVRMHRAGMKICPSAKPEIDIPQVLREISESHFFRVDYEEVTSFFAQEKVEYETALGQLQKLADGGFFA